MAILFCAVSLFIEAIDQQKHHSNSSKFHCYQYFNLLHVNQMPINYDQAYLQLIKQINA